jgi:hypothetical protein
MALSCKAFLLPKKKKEKKGPFKRERGMAMQDAFKSAQYGLSDGVTGLT